MRKQALGNSTFRRSGEWDRSNIDQGIESSSVHKIPICKATRAVLEPDAGDLVYEVR